MYTTHAGSPVGAEDLTVPSPTAWRGRPWVGSPTHRPVPPPPTAPAYVNAPPVYRPTMPPAPAPAAAPGPWTGPGYPAMPAPGSWAQPVAGRNNRRWLMAGSAVATIAAVVATVVTVGVSDDSTPAATSTSTATPTAAAPAPTSIAPPTPQPVPTAALTGLLLDPAAIDGAMGASGMVVRAPGTRDTLFTDTLDQPQCSGAWGPLLQAAYSGSGYLAVQNQILREPLDDQWLHTVFQGVVSFSSAEKAKAYVSNEAQKWGQCTGVTLRTTGTGNHDAWTIASANTSGAVLTSISTLEGGRGWGCQHAMTARNNVVIDVSACSNNPGGQGEMIAAKIADRISAA